MAIRKRIAVIGGGAAGLASSYLLSKKHDVVLFEAGPSLGGHAHSERVTDPHGVQFDVDTAFLIFNDKTYAEFGAFISALGVTQNAIPAEMSSCFSDVDKSFDYVLGNGWAPFLARPQVFLRPELIQIFADLLRFRRRAVRDLDSKTNLLGVTAGEYLAPYSRAFAENFVYPLTAAIWSLPAQGVRDYPIASLLTYFDNHQLLRGRSERRWRTFKGSSAVYIGAFTKQFSGHVHLNTPVRGVERSSEGVAVILPDRKELFDHVVLATHADTSRKLLLNPTQAESKLLKPWRYQDNPVTLHRDANLLHPNPKLWASWNMKRERGEYQISYYLNRLQSLPSSEPLVLTLGEYTGAPDRIIKSFNYRHPIFEAASVATQTDLTSLNNIDGLSYCGSYFGYGFHEDAVKSATEVAANFGIKWSTKND